MDWFKKHVDTVVILAGILSSVLWINSKINHLDREIAVIKTVLIMRNIMPVELAHKKIESEE